jgi:DNA polymerase alpha subunit A
LRSKKKYAALSAMTSERRIVRGLDLVRRDWCGLAKKASSEILDMLLSDETDVVGSACALLSEVSSRMSTGDVSTEG